jgi:Ras GTPase-activating-like protein IQGAP2/3
LDGPPQSDPHSLTGIDKASRQRLELYQHLIYLLQTEPKYLARLLSALTLHQVVGQHTKYPLVESSVLSIFGYATNPREEYLLINLCKVRKLFCMQNRNGNKEMYILFYLTLFFIQYCIKEEIKKVQSVQEFLRGNYAFMKLIVQTNR